MATHSNILAGKIPDRSLKGYSSWGHKELDMTEQLNNVSLLHSLLLILDLS